MTIRIGIGSAFAPPLPESNLWDWIQLCERLGIDSFWPSDFLLEPNLEPLTLLAAIAAKTERMRLGTNAMLLPLREPLVLAKQLSTIDYLSKGRLFPSFSLAAPWDPAWAASWLSTGHRGNKANETIALIRDLLEQDHVAFSGDHFQYEGPGIKPRPSPALSLWVGGDSPGAIQRTAIYGDGWLGGLTAPDKAASVVVRINSALISAGRTIETDHYGVTLPFRLGNKNNPLVVSLHERIASRLNWKPHGGMHEAFAVGSADEITTLLERYIEAGISKFVVLPIAGDADELLEQTERLALEVIPLIEK